MANSLSASFVEVWAREQQTIFYKQNVARMIADLSFKSQLSKGDTLNRTSRSSNNVQVYTRGTAITIDDKTDTNEQLVVNKQFATGFYVDDFDKIQNNYDQAANYGRDDGVYLSNQVDATVLGEYSNATSTVDDGDLGGTSGNGISLSTSNVLAVVSAAKKKLAKQNIPMKNLYGVVSPEFEEILVQYGAGRDTAMGDEQNRNGFITNFYGFKLFRSNQTSGTAVLALATQPTDTDTVVINGVTFTFVASIGTTAGNILIGADVDTTRASLTDLINNPGTTAADHVALSAENQRLFTENASATNDNTANTMTVAFKGVGALTVASDGLTDPTDEWTSASQKQHLVFGDHGGVTLVMQKDPVPQAKQVPDKLGVNILNGVLYGVKTFSDGAKETVNVELDSSSF